MPKNAFLVCFFLICLRRRNFGQNKDFLVLWKSSESQFGRPKNKRSTKFRFFFKSGPPSPSRKYWIRPWLNIKPGLIFGISQEKNMHLAIKYQKSDLIIYSDTEQKLISKLIVKTIKPRCFGSWVYKHI